MKNLYIVSLIIVLTLSFGLHLIGAQSLLTSSNYKILDPSIDSGGGASESNNYSMIASLGNPSADSRLVSGSYLIQSGFRSGIQPNVPTIKCVEAKSDSSNSQCITFPNSAGARGECGAQGCYNRAKLEINHEGNPVDTLYLVTLFDNTQNRAYFLQSDHTISTTYDINDYMSICAIQGKDDRPESNCNNNTKPEWSTSLQKFNVFKLTPNTSYSVSVRALNGDFTEGINGPIVTFSTAPISIELDIDIGDLDTVETDAPHSITFGNVNTSTISTPNEKIWIDLNTNSNGGIQTYVRGKNGGLSNGFDLIPSSDEDLSVDTGLNGGFGIKIYNSNQTSLGPLKRGLTFNTTNTNSVGKIRTVNSLLAYTENLNSDTGPIFGGRIGVLVKVKITSSTPGGNYSEELSFTTVPNI